MNVIEVCSLKTSNKKLDSEVICAERIEVINSELGSLSNLLC